MKLRLEKPNEEDKVTAQAEKLEMPELTVSGTIRYAGTVGDLQVVLAQEKFGNHCPIATSATTYSYS
ncbi:hypothetical protein E2C01_032409 [Portunus trituberculatus]|uniref:Uncharacterized protein n=1 Tax=Portunus trituberculatus TaxID=210409 RepID=A0A5B7EXF4_PORTR|nr:hypothetical protein [Portunus trituberculatus]